MSTPPGSGHETPQTAWLVLSDHGITAIRYNESEARQLAEDTRGLLTHIPLDADYRPQLR